MTTFYIIRHGETDYNKTGRFQGQLDIPLNDEGRRQGGLVAARMATVPLDAIYTSDLKRAEETARIIAQGRTVVLEPRLREIHVGQVMGMSAAEIAQTMPEVWADIRADRDDIPFPDGESPADVQIRAMAALADLAVKYPDGHVAVVSHGGVIKTIVAGIFGATEGFRSKFVLDNCSLTLVEWSAERRRCRSLNDTGHLVEAPCEVRADF
ncbi:MAG: alpha-ribazole phosphatase [Symbiobacteriaceae bacterium]|nr:alpha-ribazole phosphatase [Symbiobacteriaceae bacterium]